MTPMDKELVEVWKRDKTAVIRLTPEEKTVEEKDVEPPTYMLKYKLLWGEGERAYEDYMITIILPPPKLLAPEEAATKIDQLLPRKPEETGFVFPDWELPKRVMEVFIELYGTYTTPAHELSFRTRSRGGDYPDDEITLSIVYNEYH